MPEMFWKTIYLVSLWLGIMLVTGAMGGALEKADALKGAGPVIANTGSDIQEEDIQWFRDQMRISEKYIEDHEGVWGMSWAHFLTMVFLVVFAIGALILSFQRQKRTREILEMIRKEIKNGDAG